jgi:hypothetical protein
LLPVVLGGREFTGRIHREIGRKRLEPRRRKLQKNTSRAATKEGKREKPDVKEMHEDPHGMGASGRRMKKWPGRATGKSSA